jgi:lipid-binding SYLF domain-containing protein
MSVFKIIFTTFILLLCSFCASTSSRETRELNYAERLSSSIDVLKSNSAIPEKAIPEAVLKNAKAIAVIPNVVKGAFVLGGRYGKGVIATRINDSVWSYPGFISIGGGSIGWQWGVENVDLVLVFRTSHAVDSIVSGKITFGAGIGVAAGPVGRNAEASTTTQLNAQIYSYARSKGLFIGASLEGSTLRTDIAANHEYYNSDSLNQRDILKKDIKNVPPEAVRFTQEIERITGSKK